MVSVMKDISELQRIAILFAASTLLNLGFYQSFTAFGASAAALGLVGFIAYLERERSDAFRESHAELQKQILDLRANYQDVLLRGLRK
jgi:hypothetical protein